MCFECTKRTYVDLLLLVFWSALDLLSRTQYVERVKRESDLNGGDCGDTVSPFGRGAFDLAMKGAGAAITMLRAVLDGSIKNGYAVRQTRRRAGQQGSR